MHVRINLFTISKELLSLRLDLGLGRGTHAIRARSRMEIDDQTLTISASRSHRLPSLRVSVFLLDCLFGFSGAASPTHKSNATATRKDRIEYDRKL